MLMDMFVTSLLLVVAATINGARGDTMVSGTVFCDQCKDGEVSVLDYPLGGVRVLLACRGENGQFIVLREETTNWLGTYTTSFSGRVDMSNCRAQISENRQGCGATVGPAQDLRLMFKMFDNEMYTVEPLISQPAMPSTLCRRPDPPPPLDHAPLNLPPLPPLPPLPSPPTVPQLPSLSPLQSPLPPSLPPSLPPLPPPEPPLPAMPKEPFFEASACPYQMWMMPQHSCYWSVLSQDSKVSLVFGSLASAKFGENITLLESMYGRGDPYRTLLREGTTALLNSYTCTKFVYQPVEVVSRLNSALMVGSSQQVLMAALRFIKANSGQTGNTTCKFNACH